MRSKSSVVLVRSLAIAGLALPLSVGTVVLSAGSAFATSSVTCSMYKGSIPKNTAKVAYCSDSANTGGSGTVLVGGNLASGLWKINWATGPGDFSYASVTATSVAPTAPCPTSTVSEYQISGSVTDYEGTGSSIPIGDTVSATVCVNKAGKYKEAPHTKFLI
ncbi:MAG TPA: hypothetical protein VEJ87_12200 [Acidimicrobiales bacterium]|nr:hypothetical protein [Acidimicrobiales bacterium]